MKNLIKRVGVYDVYALEDVLPIGFSFIGKQNSQARIIIY